MSVLGSCRTLSAKKTQQNIKRFYKDVAIPADSF